MPYPGSLLATTLLIPGLISRLVLGTASTEDLRRAMVCYRALFGDLLGEPADTGSETAAAAADTSEQLTESDPKEMAK